jgi:hypothetical protein
MWLYDVMIGYHQLSVSKELREKLAFQGPDAIKWTYNVMPFGPTNSPATFIMMIHNTDSIWKNIATLLGLTVGINIDTRIIINNRVNWAQTFDQPLQYIECQLHVAKAYCLILSLRKSYFFPKQFEFVGINVFLDGNRPAMSKHELLKNWPTPTIIWDIASFVGFLQFYSKFIPCFEIRTKPLHEIMKREYTKETKDLWMPKAQAVFDNRQQFVLLDPCLPWFDPTKLTVLRTDFFAKGFGYVVCQPGNNKVSLELVSQFMSGNGFQFLTKMDNSILYPVAFGSCQLLGNERYLHSYLGEAFCGDFAMNKFLHMCYGCRFVWVPDCYAVKFILSYDKANQVILRLQIN